MKSHFVIAQQGGDARLAELLPVLLSREGIRVSGAGFLSWHPPQLARLGTRVRERMQIYGLRVWAIRQVLGFRNRRIFRRHVGRLRTTLNAHGIPRLEVDDVNNRRFLDGLRGLAPDLVLSMFALQRFGPELVGIPRGGCRNLHPAPLPQYRGRYSTFWELYNGERESGVSIHFMNGKWDAGPIVAVRRFPIPLGETVSSLERKKRNVAPGQLAEALDALVENRVNLLQNDLTRGAYYTVPSQQALIAFRRERRGRWY